MTLSLEEVLIEAINDEYKAQATYNRVIRGFGAIRPFINIVEAEGRHIEALKNLFHKYGFTIPEDTWDGRIEMPGSILEACRIGVQAEIDNAAMYDNLLAATLEYDDVQQVLGNLQRASQDRHLPAFQRAVYSSVMSGATTQGKTEKSYGKGSDRNAAVCGSRKSGRHGGGGFGDGKSGCGRGRGHC